MGEPARAPAGASDAYADTIRLQVPVEIRRQLGGEPLEDVGCNPYNSDEQNLVAGAPRRTLDDMRRLSYLIKLSRRHG